MRNSYIFETITKVKKINNLAYSVIKEENKSL